MYLPDKTFNMLVSFARWYGVPSRFVVEKFKERAALAHPDEVDDLRFVAYRIERKVKALENANAETSQFIMETLPDDFDEAEKQLRKIKWLNSDCVTKYGVTDAERDVAKERDIKEIMEDISPVRYGKACCPFHDDHNPSMIVKGNNVQCMAGCVTGNGKKQWDTIQLVMDYYNMDFIQAVKEINRR